MKSNFLLLKIIKPMKPFFRKSAVDFDQMVHILNLKLTLDDRKTNLPNEGGNSKKLTGFKSNLLMLAFLGFFMGMIMTMPFDLFLKMAIIASMDLFFMVMYMVTDFSNVLLDLRDKQIIMTRPVNSETLNTAKIIHIIYYMIAMFFSLNAAAIVFGVGAYGIRILGAFLVMMVTLSLLVVFATTILYTVLLAFFSGEKLKDVLNVFQIAVTIFTIVIYQVLARVFEFTALEVTVSVDWWTYLLAPAWFAGLFKVIVEGGNYGWFAVLALIVPFGLGALLKSFILPKFEFYLGKLQIEEGLRAQRRSKFKTRLYGLLAFNQTERAFMWFADSNLKRDRKLKRMIYPNQAMAMIFPLIMMYSVLETSGSLTEGLAGLKGSFQYMTLYLSTLFLTTNFELVQFSETHEAAFIYDSFPIDNKNLILTGASKAYLIKYELPIMAVMGFLMLVLMGWSALPGVIVIEAAALFLMGIKLNMGKMNLPFSKEMVPGGNKKIGETFVFMAIIGGLWAIHYFLIQNQIVWSVLATCAYLVLGFFLFRKARLVNVQ